MTIDITIPVLNEERTIRNQIKKVHDFLTTSNIENNKWKIVIVDNGSTDRTSDIVSEMIKEGKQVKLIRLPVKGVGLALQTSWLQSNADIVGYMDLDLATDLPHLLESYNAICNQQYDIVYGSRLHKKSKVIGRTMKREIVSRAFNWIVKRTLKTNFSDGMCGFKWLRRSKLSTLIDNGAHSNGWFFSTELLAVAEWQKLQVFELPIKWTDDVTESKVKITKLAKQYLKALLKLKNRKPLC